MLNMSYIPLLILAACFSVGCKKNTTSMQPPVSAGSASAKTYLALGDSYTIGQSVPAPDRFPVQTAQWLSVRGINMANPEIIATTGWTTTNLSNAIAQRSISGPYSVVSLLIGVNDQYQMHDTLGYRARFTSLLNTSIGLAGGQRDHVFVISIPDYSVTPFAANSDTATIHRQIDQFNVINKQVTAQSLCNYLDITPSTRDALNDPTLLAADGLHPSGKEYKKWAERLGTMMLDKLR
jgi:lysophospholipase L1-like esterase